jgi:hypothetical protein
MLWTAFQELAGHKLSDAVIERLPSLATLTPGGRISYSEVVAFIEMEGVERYSLCTPHIRMIPNSGPGSSVKPLPSPPTVVSTSLTP